MRNSKRNENAVDGPEHERSVESDTDEATRVWESDGPVREVAIDARLGVDDGDVRAAAAKLDVGGRKSSEYEQDALEGDKKADEVL